MRIFIGILLLAITFSSCDYNIMCRFENKTIDTVRVICFRTAEVPLLDSVEIATNSHTGGYFLGVNKDRDNQPYLHLSDSVVYFDILPKENFSLYLPMNYFWVDDRIRTYLRYVDRLEICMSKDTLIYSGKQELNQFFRDRKISKQEIRINIREKSLLNPLLDFFDSW